MILMMMMLTAMMMTIIVMMIFTDTKLSENYLWEIHGSGAQRLHHLSFSKYWILKKKEWIKNANYEDESMVLTKEMVMTMKVTLVMISKHYKNIIAFTVTMKMLTIMKVLRTMMTIMMMMVVMMMMMLFQPEQQPAPHKWGDEVGSSGKFCNIASVVVIIVIIIIIIMIIIVIITIIISIVITIGITIGITIITLVIITFIPSICHCLP